MKTLYISAPLRAPTIFQMEENIRIARLEAEQMWRLGFAVLCPHLNTYGMVGMLDDEPILDEDHFIQADLLFIKNMDFLLFLWNWEESEGAQKEHAAAEAWHITKIYNRKSGGWFSHDLECLDIVKEDMRQLAIGQTIRKKTFY